MSETQPSSHANPRYRVWLTVAVLVAFAVILGLKFGAAGDGVAGPAKPRPAQEASYSEIRGDANAAYEEARANGKPVYILFHSLTCGPCIEISGVVDEVVPAYEGSVAFVNAITDDPGARQLASRFAFQYIPTSFFIDAEGEVVDSFTGVLKAEEMRARLDSLAGR